MTKEVQNKPQPPKRPLSAFFLFRHDRYKDVVAANVGKNVADITKIIAAEWNKLCEEKKKTYQGHYNLAKVSYEAELKEYVGKYGKVERKKKIKREKKTKPEKKATKE